MKSPSRRELVAALAAGAALAATPGAGRARPARKARPDALILNDASRLNPVPVARHWIARPDDEARLVDALRAELKQAAAQGRAVCFGGARHSMGGQSLPRDGVAAAFAGARITPDSRRRTYLASAGARWRDVIRALDPLGFSVAVMQSNHDFSVGGTLSVNAHGWPVPYGPFGATVRRLRLMLADGSIVACSREDNRELFGLALGGYGLCGVLLDAELDTADNALLVPRHKLLPAAGFAPEFVAAANEPAVRMAYGRLSVARRDFFEQAILVAYRPVASAPRELPPARTSAAFSFLSRKVFRAQVGSERGKQARWYAETVIAARAATARPVTRNAILNYPVANLAGADRTRTDILHEYFVPPEKFSAFLAACQDVILPSRQDLLNVTLRYVDADKDSVLSFAPSPRIAAVMLFSQPMTREAENDMRAMTEQLIDRVLVLGGSFYLPYRLHARRDQVAAAYPRLAEFLAGKRHYDPQLRFRNLMWDRYFA